MLTENSEAIATEAIPFNIPELEVQNNGEDDYNEMTSSVGVEVLSPSSSMAVLSGSVNADSLGSKSTPSENDSPSTDVASSEKKSKDSDVEKAKWEDESMFGYKKVR